MSKLKWQKATPFNEMLFQRKLSLVVLLLIFSLGCAIAVEEQPVFPTPTRTPKLTSTSVASPSPEFGSNIIQPEAYTKFLNAKQKWDDANLEAYEIQYVIGQPKCIYDLKVISHESINATVSQKRCTSISSIEMMFDSIEQTLTQYQCHRSGCRCGRVRVNVSYQAEYGFPLMIAREMGEGMNLVENDDSVIECVAIGYRYSPTEVTKFQYIDSEE